MYLTDLMFIESGNKDTVTTPEAAKTGGGKHINFAKRRILSRVLQTIKALQQHQYTQGMPAGSLPAPSQGRQSKEAKLALQRLHKKISLLHTRELHPSQRVDFVTPPAAPSSAATRGRSSLSRAQAPYPTSSRSPRMCVCVVCVCVCVVLVIVIIILVSSLL